MMDRFVEECRKEWKRLEVPEAVFNEMAADLEADLDEAQSEGASPEAVVGNGFFDPKSFAASWAIARGVVPATKRFQERPRWPGWPVVVSAAVSLVVVLAGLALLGVRQAASAAAAPVGHGFVAPFGGPRGVFLGPNVPGPVIFLHGNAFPVIGLIFLAAGIVGLAITLWLWKPWSTLRRRRGFDESVGLPSYL